MIDTKSEYKRLSSTMPYLHFPFNKDQSLKDLAMLAADIMETPVALITLMDKDVQWIVTPYGIELNQMPRSTSFCTHTIQQDEIFLVENTESDIRFKNSPLVVNDPQVRFYAGVSLKSTDGENIGTLCVLDNKPKQANAHQLKCLEALTRQVSNTMALNLSIDVIRESKKEIEQQNEALRRIAYLQSHVVRAPLCNALGVMEMIKMNGFEANPEFITILDNALLDLDDKIHRIVKLTV